MIGNKREEILVQLVTILNTVDTIATVERKRPTIEELSLMANTQLPKVVVEGGFPVQVGDKLVEGRGFSGSVIKHKYILPIYILGYAVDNVTPDTTVGSLYDDVHRAIFTDPLLGGLLVVKIKDNPEETSINYFSPYVVFRVKYDVEYTTVVGI